MHLAKELVALSERILEKTTPLKCSNADYLKDELEWDFGPYTEFSKLKKSCQQHKIMKVVKVGKAMLKLVRLKVLKIVYVEYLRKNTDQSYGDTGH